MTLHDRAGQSAKACDRIDIPRLVCDYYSERPDPSREAERVAFGTSGHRGSSESRSFNDAHIAAITAAISDYRAQQGIDGPLFIGADTHALSEPALRTALEVLAAHRVEVMVDSEDRPVPTPSISNAILNHNRESANRRADGIIITPSHNPPRDGGFKYNPPHAGPAGTEVTQLIEAEANRRLESGTEIPRIAYSAARQAATTHRFDYVDAYVSGLERIIDFEVIRNAGLHIGVDPMGGAAIDYWEPIASRYQIDLEVVRRDIDPTFGFMTLDWDGQIRMDCSSPHAMQNLVRLSDKYDVSFGNDTDTDRHGIVTPDAQLMNPNHFLAVAVDYLFRHRPDWPSNTRVGKTLVSSALIDRVAERLGREVYEVPVGFKWFVPELLEGRSGFAGEESAGASFLTFDAQPWSTDKDGIILGLLAAEITARIGSPSLAYKKLTRDLGRPSYARFEAPATREEKSVLKRLSASDFTAQELAGDPITQVLTEAPGNRAPIGGVKVMTEKGWFAARPSGTEAIYKIYAESFEGPAHLDQIQSEAQAIVAAALKSHAG